MPAPMMMPTPPAVTSTRPSTRCSCRCGLTATLSATTLPGVRAGRHTTRAPTATPRCSRCAGCGAATSQRGEVAPLESPAGRGNCVIHRSSGVAQALPRQTPGGNAMNLKTILVPLDGSIVAEGALEPAVDLARAAGAKLVLLRAAEAHPMPMADPVEAQVSVMGGAQDYLAGARERVMAAGVADVEVSAWYGSPVDAIVEAARFSGADMIVMSRHGRSGVARVVVGGGD